MRLPLLIIGAFRLAGYFNWNEEAAGTDGAKPCSKLINTAAFGSCLLYLWSVRLTVQDAGLSTRGYRFESGTGYKWFFGVRVNMADCRSAAAGLPAG